MERPAKTIVPPGVRRFKASERKGLDAQIFALKTSAAANFCGRLGVTGPAKQRPRGTAEECHGSSPFRQLGGQPRVWRSKKTGQRSCRRGVGRGAGRL